MPGTCGLAVFSPLPKKRYSVRKAGCSQQLQWKHYNLPPTMNKNKIHSLCCCFKISMLVLCALSLPPRICKELKHYIWWTAKIPLHLKCRTPMKQRNVGFLKRSRLKKQTKKKGVQDSFSSSLVLEKLSRILLHTIKKKK